MDNKSNKFKYINNFPIIIMVAVAILIIILVNVYLSFKPYKTIYNNGYMVLSNNMTYNLINTNTISDDLNVGAVLVKNGDNIYKQVDSYYVGDEEKKEIEFDYPMYSTDGLTVYNTNENTTLINRNFEKLNGYSGLSLNYGILYNDGDPEPADDIDYLFLSLNNNIYINAQVITIKTLNNEYNISINSPCYFSEKYANYYVFDGKNFNYQRISDIYYDSLIKIGDVTLTYEKFLVKMGILKVGTTAETNDIEEEQKPIDEKPLEPESLYKLPEITINNFNSNVYSIESSILISDSSNTITTAPTFELYIGDKLYSRKKISISGDFKISGLSANTEYSVVGKYKYKDKTGIIIEKEFYNSKIKTKDINDLEFIKIESNIGSRRSNQLEIKNLKITNIDTEAISNIKKVSIVINNKGDNSSKKYDLNYSQMSSLLGGKAVDILTPTFLESNTIYDYTISFYDKDENLLKAEGNINGTFQTSKTTPSINYTSSIDKKSNKITINISTSNKDNIYIDNYIYILYDSLGNQIDTEKTLSYTDGSLDTLVFENLDYNKNYIVNVTGGYDLSDGNGEQYINENIAFTTASLSSDFIAYYDANTLEVTNNSIKSDIYISGKTTVLQKEDTKLTAYLVDSEGNDILNEEGALKYYNIYNSSDLEVVANGYYKVTQLFENLLSNTEYYIKLKITVKQVEQDIEISKKLTPSITTNLSDASLEINYKKLIGTTLDLSFNVNDYDNLINNNQVIVEIYEGHYESIDDISSKSIYREVKQIRDSSNKLQTINITLNDYNAEEYTVLVSANPYKGSNVKKYIDVKTNLATASNCINISRNITVKSQMYQQRLAGKKLNTEIELNYNLNDFKGIMLAIDCNDIKCQKMGYLYVSSYDELTQTPIISFESFDGEKYLYEGNRLTIKNDKANIDHTFYLTIEKSNAFIADNLFDSIYMNDLYLLTSLEYNTNSEIYNIDEASDFYDQSLIKDSSNKKYVVTNDLDFYDYVNNKSLITNSGIKNFVGSIDFQGHNLEFYVTNDYNLESLFYTIGKQGILKNLKINYHLQYDGVLPTIREFITSNYGTINNIVVTVEQENIYGRAKILNLLTQSNYASGVINNFVTYLKSDIQVYSNATESGLLVYYNSGTIKNGYISKDPNSNLISTDIICHDEYSRFGTFIYVNYGMAKNLYNLVNVLSSEPSTYKGYGLATIAFANYGVSTLKNTLSVATATQKSPSYGPNVISLSVTSKISNNYYVDTKNISYNNKYNKKISSSSLTNVGTLDVIFNDENEFTNTAGYYPLLKMNSFMYGYQKLIPVSYDYKNSKVDIVSSKTLNDNINEEETAKVELYINNPDHYNIINVTLENVDATIEENSQVWNEATQITTVVLKLKNPTIAKDSYNIKSFQYIDSAGNSQIKTYDDNNVRIVDVQMFKMVEDYKSLVDSIDKNQNICLTNDIKYDSSKGLPGINKTYSATFDGNRHKLDFANKQIDRGYFVSTLSGKLMNLQILNLKISAVAKRIGFIANATSAYFNNIDISNSKIVINNNLTEYVGFLSAENTSITASRCSINDIEISQKENIALTDVSIGNLFGTVYSSTIENSYVYNGKINMYLDSLVGYKTIGGAIGKLLSSTLKNSYTFGTIDTDFSNVGGIIGTQIESTVKNNYSYVNINSAGDFAGGIVGNVITASSISYNMYIGKIYNVNNNDNFDLIAPSSLSSISNNYSTGDQPISKKIPKKTTTLMEFDNDFNNQIYLQDYQNPYSLPYLKTASTFINQRIKTAYLEASNEILYTIEYNDTYSPDISSYYSNTLLEDDLLYTNALSDKAIITFEDASIEIINSSDLEYVKINPGKYELMPKDSYLSSYSIEVNDGRIINLYDLSFYRKIFSEEDWNKIKNCENVILKSDIVLNSTSTFSKKINVLLGNNHKISTSEELNNSLIYWNNGTIRDVEFSNISLKPNSPSDYFGLISFNTGKIINCNFNNIEIYDYANKVGVIGSSTGYIKDVVIDNINVTGIDYVGSLVGSGYSDDTANTHVENVKGSNIKVYGSIYVGGLIGRTSYKVLQIDLQDIYIGPYLNPSNKITYPKKCVGGITGSGFVSNSSITTSNDDSYNYIYATGNYIGGITGYITGGGSALKVDNLIISDMIEVNGNKLDNNASYWVGGISGSGDIALSKAQVQNLNIKITGSYVGGIIGYSYGIQNSIILDSNFKIIGNYVGGMLGRQMSSATSTQGNAVLNTDLTASGNYVGGIIGYYYNLSGGSLKIIDNIVSNSSLTSADMLGGIVGRIQNDNNYIQNLIFENNYVYGTRITAISEKGISGGLIGYLDQIPKVTRIKFNNSLFYGETYGNKTGYGVSFIANTEMESEAGYNAAISEYDSNQEYTIEDKFSMVSGFKKYVSNIEADPNYQINNSGSLNEMLSTKLKLPDDDINDSSEYFPILNYSAYPSIDKQYWVELPTVSSEITEQAVTSSFMSKPLMAKKMYSFSSRFQPLNINYDIYASDVNKLNIEFSNIDPSVYFYYKIGDFKSQYIPITNRTYTISYDFKKDFEIYLTNYIDSKSEKIKVIDLIKTVSLINNKTYYLNDSLLYGEDNLITGNFVNLYNNNALTSDGKIYNIETKNETDANVDYAIMETANSLYTFNYNNQVVDTYYNYSIVDGNQKEYQLFVKNGMLNVINNNLNNNKSSYIFDYYNNMNIQVILKDGKLYNLNGSIKSPSSLVNNGISEIYSNIGSSLNLAVLKYSNGKVYTFDYRTGTEIFDNSSNEYSGIFDYIKSKLFGTSTSNKIESITSYDKYTEIELLKDKIFNYSIEDAINKINNDNGTNNIKDNYITVYNGLTKNYNIYSVNDLLNASDYIESETDKIFKDYELTQFYNPVKKSDENNSISGILLFALSIIAILISLGLLISRKRKQRFC